MSNSYASIQRQIAALQAQADKARSAEKAGVIAKIQAAIKVYGIEPTDIFGRPNGSTKKGKAVKSKIGTGAKYADGTGNEWGGRGPRPQWLRNALAGGASLESFAAGSGASVGEKKSLNSMKTRNTTTRPKRKRKLPVKFRDGAGNTWTGRGSQPRWLRAAIESGKTLDDLRV